MLYDEVKDYCFNFFDFIKMILKKDYLCIKVGILILNCNLENFFV